MRAAVRYYTKSGNTKKLAEAIAAELGIEAKPVTEPLNEKTETLFLCSSVYWAGIDRSVKEFVKANAEKIGVIVNVSTAALIDSTYSQMKNVASEAGAALSNEEFHCRGRFAALHAGHPDEKDLEAARKFARKVIG